MDYGILKVIAAVILLIAAFVGRTKIIEYRDARFYERRDRQAEKTKSFFMSILSFLNFILTVIFIISLVLAVLFIAGLSPTISRALLF